MSDALNAILKQGGKSALGDTTSPALSKMLGAKAPSSVAPKRTPSENPLEVPVDPDSVSSIVGRTVDNLQASFAGTVAAVGEATGSEYLKDWGEAEVQAQQEEASQYGAPSSSSYTQVNDLESMGSYLKELGVSGAPDHQIAKLEPGAIHLGQHLNQIIVRNLVIDRCRNRFGFHHR